MTSISPGHVDVRGRCRGLDGGAAQFSRQSSRPASGRSVVPPRPSALANGVLHGTLGWPRLTHPERASPHGLHAFPERARRPHHRLGAAATRWRAPSAVLYSCARRSVQCSTAVGALRALVESLRPPRPPCDERSIRMKHGGDAVGTQDPNPYGLSLIHI